MKKTLLMLALVAGITSFAQNATAALIYNASPGFSAYQDYVGGPYSFLPNADPYGGGFFLIQSSAVPGYYDFDYDEEVEDYPATSSLSSYSESHFSFASLNDVVNSSLVPPENGGIGLVNGTYYIAFDVQDQLNGNAVYYGWMNVTVEGVDTMDAVSFTLNEWAYDNTGAPIMVGQVSSGVGAPVPEPGTWAAAALLAGGTAFMRWRKRAKVA